MDTSMRNTVFSFTAAIFLSACGGSGGGGTTPSPSGGGGTTTPIDNTLPTETGIEAAYNSLLSDGYLEGISEIILRKSETEGKISAMSYTFWKDNRVYGAGSITWTERTGERVYSLTRSSPAHGKLIKCSLSPGNAHYEEVERMYTPMLEGSGARFYAPLYIPDGTDFVSECNEGNVALTFEGTQYVGEHQALPGRISFSNYTGGMLAYNTREVKVWIFEGKGLLVSHTSGLPVDKESGDILCIIAQTDDETLSTASWGFFSLTMSENGKYCTIHSPS